MNPIKFWHRDKTYSSFIPKLEDTQKTQAYSSEDIWLTKL